MNTLAATKPTATAPSSLVRSAYRTLLREATFFDNFPLAKSLLSASPFLRQDSSWVAMVNRTDRKPRTVSDVFRATAAPAANTFSIGAPTQPMTMRTFVQQEFRHAENTWDAARFFACVRRLEAAKDLHERCSHSIPPALAPVTPKLQMLDQPSQFCAPGTLLLAHPVLLDDFTQAVVMLTGHDTAKRSVTGLALNNESGTVGQLLNKERLEHLAPSLIKRIPQANNEHFAAAPIFIGGFIQSLPILLHRSAAVAAAMEKIAGSKAMKVAKEEKFHHKVHGGWYVHSLLGVMCLDAELVATLNPTDFRVILNYSEWSTAQLTRETVQNWWLPTERVSSSRALRTLLNGSNAQEMWHRAISSLGGDMSDFSRLKLMMPGDEDAEEFGDAIAETFHEDAAKINSPCSSTENATRF